MAVEIREIQPTKGNLLKFVHFPIDVIYRDNEYYVPPLVTDEVNTLRPDKNPAFDFCEAVYFLAYRNGEIVGRIAGIINKVVNERANKKEARFSYIDFIDDAEVADALIDAVTRWAKGKGMEHLTGPLGFTDMDPEGLLVEGFDRIGTTGAVYSHAYYHKHLERMGFVKDVDWLEFLITIPTEVPEKMHRIATLISERMNVTTIKYTDRKQLVKDYGDAIFKLINVAYDELFGRRSPTSRSSTTSRCTCPSCLSTTCRWSSTKTRANSSVWASRFPRCPRHSSRAVAACSPWDGNTCSTPSSTTMWWT